MFVRITSLLMLICLLSTTSVFAAVDVNVSDKGEYTRVVFNWDKAPEYKLSKPDESHINIDFTKAHGGLSVEGGDIRILSIGGEGDTAARINFQGVSRTRHFAIGNRIIVDFYHDKNATLKEKEVQKATQTKPDKVEEVVAPEENIADVKPPPRVVEEPLPETLKNAHVVEISATSPFNMAAFLRGEYLWIVTDQPNMVVPPQVKGPKRQEFLPLHAQSVDGGSAWYMRAPHTERLYAEGGGLLWRVIFSPQRTTIQSLADDRARESLAGLDSVPKFKGPVLPQGRPFKRIDTGTKANIGAKHYLSVTMEENPTVLSVPDPVVGDTLHVVLATQSNVSVASPYNFAQFDVLPSIIGGAIDPAIDSLRVDSQPNGFIVYDGAGGVSNGLAILSQADVMSRSLKLQELQRAAPNLEEKDTALFRRRIFHFQDWYFAQAEDFKKAKTGLYNNYGQKSLDGRATDLLTLAKLHTANGLYAESLGYLRLAGTLQPELQATPSFLALRGAARLLQGRYIDGLEDSLAQALSRYPEIGFWRAYGFARLEDWKQAYDVLPDDYSLLSGYPAKVRIELGLMASEIALRNGNTEIGEGLLRMLEHDRDVGLMDTQSDAAWNYLFGESQRQLDAHEKAVETWSALLVGRDSLHRVKAGLALTNLQLEREDISVPVAIDRLERLKFTWRGDALEIELNRKLGRLYIDHHDYLKGFSILRETAGLAGDSQLGKNITLDMVSMFKELFMGDNREEISPLEAITIYEEFSELTPSGEDGDRLLQALSERLVEVDLFDRAISILEHQVDHRLKGVERERVATRLAAIYLLNDMPRETLDAIKTAEDALTAISKNPLSALETGPAQNYTLEALEILAEQYEVSKTQPEYDPGQLHLNDLENPAVRSFHRSLLKARSFADLGRYDQALRVLADLPDIQLMHRLRASIAWEAELWDEAAYGLRSILTLQGVDRNSDLDYLQSNILLNMAVAYNLAGNRLALEDLRRDYLDEMNETVAGRMFEVITRERKDGSLADRKTLMNIVEETELFRNFLEAYETDTLTEIGRTQ